MQQQCSSATQSNHSAAKMRLSSHLDAAEQARLYAEERETAALRQAREVVRWCEL